MLTIELRAPRDGVCPVCNDTGIVLPKKRDGQVDVGTFCRECKAGSDRWERTLEIMSAFDRSPNGGQPHPDRSQGMRSPSTFVP